MYIPEKLFVHGNAAATAANIAAHESLFRVAIASEPLAAALWLFVPLALYRLLREVDPSLAAVMVILGSLMQVPLFFFNTVTDAAALLLVRGADFLSVVGKPQRDAFAMLFLSLHHHVDLVNFVFAGLWLFPFGLLVYRSLFLPRFLGIWLMTACLAWLVFSFTGLLVPGSEDRVLKLVQPFTLGEVATMLWLVILGAKEPRLTATGS
jgi:hypothetical protein